MLASVVSPMPSSAEGPFHESWCVNVLAVVRAEGALVGVLRGLTGGLGLGDDLDALLTVGGDTDGLLVNVTGVLWAN